MIIWIVCGVCLCLIAATLYYMTYSREGFQQAITAATGTPRAVPVPVTAVAAAPQGLSDPSNSFLCNLLTTTRGNVQESLQTQIAINNQEMITVLQKSINDFNSQLAMNGCAV